eukprot:6478688-Amphidinium_carterae.1
MPKLLFPVFSPVNFPSQLEDGARLLADLLFTSSRLDLELAIGMKVAAAPPLLSWPSVEK